MRPSTATALSMLDPQHVAEQVHLAVRARLAQLGAPFDLRPSAQRNGADTVSPEIERLVRFAQTGDPPEPSLLFHEAVGRVLGPSREWPTELLAAYRATSARQQLASGACVLLSNLAALSSLSLRQLREDVAKGHLRARCVDGHWYVDAADAIVLLSNRNVKGFQDVDE